MAEILSISPRLSPQLSMDSDDELDIVSNESSDVEVDTSKFDAQIAAINELKQKEIDKVKREKKRERKEKEQILVAGTPVKKEKVKLETFHVTKPRPPNFVPLLAQRPKVPKPGPPAQTLPSLPPSAIAGPSRMAASLAAVRRPVVSRSNSGSQWAGRAKSMPVAAKKEVVSDAEDDDGLEVGEEGVRRDDVSLAVIEKLKLGPVDFGYDVDGTEAWEYVEPNSGIRLNKRTLPHSTMQENHMYGRYYLSPSLLYSVIRLSRDGATYDIPVDNDWVTIAVVAERGDVKVSGGGGNNNNNRGGLAEEDSSDEDRKPDLQKGDFSLVSPSKKKYQKKKAGADDNQAYKRRGPKKYLNLRLAAMPSRAKQLREPGSGSGGDAVLQLLLFQADSVIRSEEEDEDGNYKTTFKGGSGGAYEKWGNLNVGDVVGIISPRVLRPLRAGKNAPHPLTLPLALNPNSAESIFVIGKSKDLGCCTAIQRDGNRCRTWVDLRQHPVCEYHLHLAMQRSRGKRAEFTASTNSFKLSDTKSSMSSSSAHRPGQPPTRPTTTINHKTKTGLLPASGAQVAPRGDNGGGGATYLVAGKTVQTGRSEGDLNNFGDEQLGERLGRGRASKDKRKRENKETEKVLQRLMLGGQGTSGDKNMKAVQAQNKAMDKEKQRDKEKEEVDRGEKRSSSKRKAREEKEEEESEEDDRKRPFTSESIKRIGYDPTAVARAVGLGKDEKKRKDEAIASLKNTEGAYKFNPRLKVESVNVKAPDGYVPGTDKRNTSKIYIAAKEADGDNDDNDEEMIDLD